jgi:thymidylate synthase (FAD)
MQEEPQQIQRVTVPAIEAILGKALPVLDGGFVRVMDYMGGDDAIVQAARVSYGRGTKRLHEDRSLIRYLMRHGHTTPFEMCEIKFHLRTPMDCWRQWIRHRTANVNEYSTRYSVAIDAAQRTPPDGWRAQARQNRQGSGPMLDAGVGTQLSEREADVQRIAREVYEERLAKGVAREQARKDLPLSTYTEAYWKIDLHNLFHFLEVRMDQHAQEEIRAYATLLGNEVVSRWCPVAWGAFCDYRLSGIAFTRSELAVLQGFRESPEHARQVAITEGLLKPDGSRPKRNSELEELELKLATLGYDLPWRSP